MEKYSKWKNLLEMAENGKYFKLTQRTLEPCESSGKKNQ